MSDTDFVLEYDSERRALTGVAEFEIEARFLLFAWSGQGELHWAKDHRPSSAVYLELNYHKATGHNVQLIAFVNRMCYDKLILKDRQVPSGDIVCQATLGVPSVLYETIDHGIGLLAIPRRETKTRRRALWHIRPEVQAERYFPFANAYGRYGVLTGNPFYRIP